MRQVMYVSESRIGGDAAGLDRVLEQSRHNNAIDGITGLLWCDGQRFAQVVEGGDEAVAALLTRIATDPRHAGLRIVHDVVIGAREFGDWSMTRPASDPTALLYEERMLTQLAQATDRLQVMFRQIITGARSTAS